LKVFVGEEEFDYECEMNKQIEENDNEIIKQIVEQNYSTKQKEMSAVVEIEGDFSLQIDGAIVEDAKTFGIILYATVQESENVLLKQKKLDDVGVVINEFQSKDFDLKTTMINDGREYKMFYNDGNTLEPLESI